MSFSNSHFGFILNKSLIGLLLLIKDAIKSKSPIGKISPPLTCLSIRTHLSAKEIKRDRETTTFVATFSY
jgi:hypothetical protein